MSKKTENKPPISEHHCCCCFHEERTFSPNQHRCWPIFRLTSGMRKYNVSSYHHCFHVPCERNRWEPLPTAVRLGATSQTWHDTLFQLGITWGGTSAVGYGRNEFHWENLQRAVTHGAGVTPQRYRGCFWFPQNSAFPEKIWSWRFKRCSNTLYFWRGNQTIPRLRREALRALQIGPASAILAP